MDILYEHQDLLRIGIGHKLSQNIMRIYERKNYFHWSVTSINEFLNKYNSIVIGLTSDEETLLEAEIGTVNGHLMPAITSLKWTENGNNLICYSFHLNLFLKFQQIFEYEK